MGIDKAKFEALLQVLKDEDAVNELLSQSRQVNQVIEDNDLMRRSVQQKLGSTSNFRQVNPVKDNGNVLVATDRFVAGVADQVFTTDAWTNLVERVGKIETWEKRVVELEKDNAVLRARVVELERDMDEKVTERLHDMPANQYTVIDLPHNSVSLRQTDNQAVTHNDPTQYEYSQARAALQNLTQMLNKSEGGR